MSDFAKLVEGTPTQEEIKRVRRPLDDIPTYVCGKCCDRGFIVEDVEHPSFGQVRVGNPCLSCSLGVGIAERIKREKDEKSSRRFVKPKNTRLSAVERFELERDIERDIIGRDRDDDLSREERG